MERHDSSGIATALFAIMGATVKQPAIDAAKFRRDMLRLARTFEPGQRDVAVALAQFLPKKTRRRFTISRSSV